MSVVNSQDVWWRPLLPAEGGRFVVAHGWGRDLLDVGDKLVWGCLCQALVIAAPPWLEARPCGLALVGCVTIGGELALRGAGHRAANLYAVDPPGGKP